MDKTDWDNRHADDDDRRWAGEPCPFVVSEAAALRPGRALDLECGQGRHAVWLAEHGWHVTGVDFSTVGLGKALTFAASRGVTCDGVPRWEGAVREQVFLERILAPSFG